MMLFTGAANSQVLKEYFDESFVLDDNLPDDTSYHYKASDHTLMKTGFLYSPRTDNFGRFDIGEGQPQPVNPPGFGHNNGMGYGGAFSNSGMVGTIPYDFSVSETGAAVITVPLELPSGPNGIKPDLAFVYNSQGGDGIMGVRWSLGGMSKISRTPYTYEFNDYSAAITFSEEDQLSLDGMMLIKDDSGNGVRYYPEVIDGSYITVSSLGFMRHAANGWIYEYCAKYYLQNRTGSDDDKPIEWHLSRAVDPFGNEIVYSYSNDVAKGSFLPRKIEYGHKVDGRYPYTVKFYYFYPEDSGILPTKYPYGWWDVDNGRPDTQKKYFSDRKENGTVGCFSRITQTLAFVKIISNAIEIPAQGGQSTIVTDFSNHCYKLNYMMEGDLKKPHLSLIEEGICTHDEEKIEEMKAIYPLNQREPLYFSWKTDSLSLQRQVPFVQESDSLFSMEKYYDDDTDWAQECMLGGHFSEKYTNDFIYVMKMKSTNEYYVKAFRNMSCNPAYCWSDDGYNVSEINDFLMGKNNLVKKFDICDTDADGIDEFMVVYLNTQSAQNCSVVIFKPNPNANGKFELNLLDNVPIPPDAASSLQVADFNGDQISDLMYLKPNTNGTKTVTFRISSAGSEFCEVVDGSCINNNNKIVFGDFDGDKHTSVLIISENQSEVHSEILRIIPNQGNGQERHQVQTFDLGNGLFPGYWVNHEFSSRIIAGDYNGDGKTDILDIDVFTLEEENWNFFFSKGNGLFEIMKRKDREFDNSDYLYPVDLNNDGCCDICCIAKNRKKIDEYYYQFEWYRFDYMIRPDYEKVNVFSESLTETTIYIDTLGIHTFTYDVPFETYQADSLKSYFGNWAATIGTFNGLSNNQMFFCRPQIHNGNFKLKTVLTYYPENKTRHVIDTIIDGFGVSRIINYTPVACQDLSVFGRDAGEGKNAPDPIHLYRGNLDVVKQVKYESELDNFDDVVTDYYFKNARYDTHGRGFIGFDESLIEERSGKKIYKRYSYDNVRHFMVPEKTTLSAVDESIVETYEYGFKNLSGHFPTKCFKPFQRNVRKKYYKNGSNYKTETDMISADDFDEWGNVLKTTRQYSGDGGQVVTHRKYQNFSNGDQRYLGLVTSDSVQYALVPGETPIVKCVNYEYNNKGRVTKKTLEKDAPNRTEETYTYDGFGNMTSKTVASQGISKTESMTYCPKGIFMLSKTDAMGHTTSYTYHKIRCLLATETDPNGLTTSYHYNTIGELGQVIRPDGTEQRMGKRWINDYIIPDYEINYYSHPDCPDSLRVAYYSWSQESNGPMLYSFYDHHQNKLRDVTVNNAGDYADDDETYVDYEYDYTTEKRIHEGFLSKKSVPYLHPYIPPEDPYMHRHDSMPPPPEPEAPDLRHWYHYRYDNMDRLMVTTRDDGYSSANHIYNGLCENMQGFDGQQKLTFYLPNGLLDSVVDNNNGSYMKYRYYADGNLKSVTLNGDDSTTVSYTYDNYGNLAMMIDPALDTVVYRYNAFGDLLHYTDSKGTTDYEYDLLGRMTHRHNAELDTDWNWDAENAIGQLESSLQTNLNGEVRQVEEFFKYDEYGRMKEHAQAIDGGELLAFKYAYNANGRLKNTTYPSGLKLTNTYDTYGTLVKIKHNGKPIWEAKKFNAYGTLDEYKTNRVYTVQQTFDTITGDLTSKRVKRGNTSYFLQHYQWDKERGNLLLRSDAITGLSEDFAYDNFNRLITITTKKSGSLVNMIKIQYDAFGNITYKEDAGSYGYADDGNPYSINTLSGVAHVDDFAEDQLATYTTFNKLATLEQGDKHLQIAYGPDDQRVWQQVTAGGQSREKRYFTQLYETVTEDGVTKNLHYLYAPSGLFAIFATSDNTETMHYTFTDHQGSLAAYTGNAKEPVTRLSYDAWGRRRNAEDGSYGNVPALATDRGYTGHEHLDAFGLINMNGRMYDPMLGRMLSPDIVVQQTDYTQSYNRYSYCFNNPLRFTDPTGWVTTVPPEFKKYYYSDILLDPEKYLVKLSENGAKNATYDTRPSEGMTKITYSWYVGNDIYSMRIIDHGMKGEQMCENSCGAFAVAAQEARLNGNPELTEAYYMEKTENACQNGLVYSELLEEHIQKSSVYKSHSYGNKFYSNPSKVPEKRDFENKAFGIMNINRGVSFRFYDDPEDKKTTYGHVMNVSNAVEFQLNNAVMEQHELNLWNSHFIYDEAGVRKSGGYESFFYFSDKFYFKMGILEK